MRNLEFRAWDKITKRYYIVSGLEYDDNGELCEIYLAGIQIDESDSCANVREPSDVVLEQDTGLKDRNDKEIYEGDIVKADCRIYEVAWFEKDGGWFCFRENDSVYTPLYHLKSEVIGNIHENPWLVEEEE